MKPFRWNLKKREQLGKLLEGEKSRTYKGYEEDLLECVHEIVASCGGKELVFVGRSPENLFNFLSGAMETQAGKTKFTH